MRAWARDESQEPAALQRLHRLDVWLRVVFAAVMLLGWLLL